jgi:hypothetical protein
MLLVVGGRGPDRVEVDALRGVAGAPIVPAAAICSAAPGCSLPHKASGKTADSCSMCG